jgi:hypothetical protein
MVKRFSEFLTESSGALTAAQFAQFLAAIPERQRQFFATVLEKVNQYVPAAGIPNPEFESVKQSVNAAIDRLRMDKPEWVMEIVRADRSSDLINKFYYDAFPAYINQVPGKLKLSLTLQKKATTATEQRLFQWLVPILQELDPLAKAMDLLKAKIQKRQPKAAEDKVAKYVAPMGSMASGKLILDALTEMSQRIYDGVKNSLIEYYTDTARNMDGLSVQEQQRYLSHDVFKMSMWDPTGAEEWVVSSGGYKSRRRKMALKNTFATVIADKAKQEADDMQKTFTVKNASKLVSILDAKQAPLAGKPVILSARGLQAGRFECELRVTFADGSQFDVQNQVVIKQNQYGTVFMQYPTTFHNVLMPGGAKMGQPSEERMNTIFAKA